MRRDLRRMLLPAGILASSVCVLLVGLVGGNTFYDVVAALIAVFGLILGAVRYTNAPLVKGQPVTLQLNATSVRVGARRLRRATLSQGVQEPAEDGVMVQLRGSRFLQPTVLHVEDRAGADRLLAELGLDAQGRTAHFWAQSELMATRWYVPAVILSSLVVIAFMVQGVAAGWPRELVLALAASFAVLTLGSAIPVLFSVGLDGINVRKLGRAEFLPWSKIARVTPFRSKSVLVEAGGIELEVIGRAKPVRLAMSVDRFAADTPERLAARVEQARAAATSNRANLTLAGSHVERVRAAKAVLEGEPGYREGHVDPEAVSALVRDPSADPEDRLAAAKALAGSESGRARVRIAVNTTAERSVRDALTSALAEAEALELEDAASLRRR